MFRPVPPASCVATHVVLSIAAIPGSSSSAFSASAGNSPGADASARIAAPIAGFSLQSEDYLRMGEDLAAAGLPALFVFEGGYAVAEVGINAANVLEGFAQRAR